MKPDPKANYKGIIDAFVKIVQNEGALRPVRGMGVVALGAGPAHALYFSCYEFFKNNFSGSDRPGENSMVNGVAGVAATLLHDAVMVPSDGKLKLFWHSLAFIILLTAKSSSFVQFIRT